MRKSILFILIFANAFLIESCYTVMNQRNVNKTYNEPQLHFPQNSNINTALAGVWINKKLWMDYGYQYRRLEINNNGSVIYIPDSERNNSKIFYGNYRTLSDTLVIEFNGRDNTEWMSYRLNADTLYIINLKERKGTGNNLVNDCYSCRKTWLRIQ